jgi:hypothetical protein
MGQLMVEEVDISPALYDRLHQIARQGGTAYYSELAPLIGSDSSDPYFGVRIGRIPDEVNHAEHAAGRPLLSAIVIAKETGMPGEGFFTCARDLKRYAGRDDLAYWVEELRLVHYYWSKH